MRNAESVCVPRPEKRRCNAFCSECRPVVGGGARLRSHGGPSWRRLWWCLLFWAVVALLQKRPLLLPTCDAQSIVQDMCSLGSFYDDFDLASSNMRQALEELLSRMHRNPLPYTGQNGEDDVWTALTNIDVGNDSNTVRGIYSQVDIAASLAGDADGWNREHLWPQSRGVGDESSSNAAYTDLHHLRPCEWSINSARGNKVFGSCASNAEKCTTPATDGAANDTEADAVSFLPPANVRGDIARALFYMDVRYSASNHNGIDLVLSDCPNSGESTMAFLSQLLEWHDEDPVSDEESDRNTKVCEWQGNRNPFVDFPFMVSELFGSPSTRPYSCNATTTGPTESALSSPSPTPSKNESPTLINSKPTVAPVGSNASPNGNNNNNETLTDSSGLTGAVSLAWGSPPFALAVIGLWLVS